MALGEFADLPTGDRHLRATNALWDAGVAEHEGIALRLLRSGELFELPDQAFPASASTRGPGPGLLDGVQEVAEEGAAAGPA